MATLPTGGLDISGNLTIQNQPSLTWYLNQSTGRTQGTIDGLDAVRQAVEIILNTERFRWQIFLPSSGMQWNGLIGQDPGYVVAELQRRLWDALRMDDRILGIDNFQYQISGDILSASFLVKSVYGAAESTMEVTIA